MAGFPILMHTALDATDPRALAEFYRAFLGLRYRPGDEPPEGGGPDEADWLVLVDGDGRRVLAVNRVRRLDRPTWPTDDVPKQMHHDFRVPDVAGLERHRRRAEELGATLLLDRSGDEEEPLHVLADPAGHPFCILVAGEGEAEAEGVAEAGAVLAVLERNRRTFAWKTADLDAAALAATTAASTMTLGGLVKHMALVEADWLVVKLAGLPYGEPWEGVDFDADPDWEWRTGAQDPPGEVQALWLAAVERSRAVVADVLRERGMDGPASFGFADGRTPTVRAMLLDMIEEYARHTGHADLLREAVDGRVGESAPPDFSV